MLTDAFIDAAYPDALRVNCSNLYKQPKDRNHSLCKPCQHNTSHSSTEMMPTGTRHGREQTTASSTSRISTSSSSQDSCSALSSSDVGIVGESNLDAASPSETKACKDVDSKMVSQDHISEEVSPKELFAISMSATPSSKKTMTQCRTRRTGMQSPFAAPDRFATMRDRLGHDTSPIRTSLPPDRLQDKERYERQQDQAINVFRPRRISRSRRATRLPQRLRNQQARAPHYIPSFVREDDAEFTNDDASLNHFVSRIISLRYQGTWGPSTAIPMRRLHGIEIEARGLIASGSYAPMLHTDFLDTPTDRDRCHEYGRRVALALNIDRARRVLPVTQDTRFTGKGAEANSRPVCWGDSIWNQPCGYNVASLRRSISKPPEKVVPNVAFRVLDAPRLKDDYYCSVLAYSTQCRTLAVALSHRVYLWTEQYGVRYPPLSSVRPSNYVMSLAFSSERGGKAILAIGRSSGNVTLWSLMEPKARIGLMHRAAACCISFRPVVTKRVSSVRDAVVDCEDMLVGDDSGVIHYYSIEWPNHMSGFATLLVKLEAHSQNICGLAWSPDGRHFVSGGNNNSAALFVVSTFLNENRDIRTIPEYQVTDAVQVVRRGVNREIHLGLSQTSPDQVSMDSDASHEIGSTGIEAQNFISDDNRLLAVEDIHRATEPPLVPPPLLPERQQHTSNRIPDVRTQGLSNAHKYIFRHSAAVKAIAFAPWQPTLFATGGGSNDRQVHFHHTGSGSTLAVINVFAQITSLVWSKTRREIAATFGYAQPEHEIRIAVFAWPSCQCVVSIPWERKSNGEIGRALWAIPYPGGPNDNAPKHEQNSDDSFNTWQTVGQRERQTRSRIQHGLPTPDTSPERAAPASSIAPTLRNRLRRTSVRAEGEVWASRTEDEGSMIVACCDQTVKFFEVWAGKSKGRSPGLGSRPGVLGGSRVLEGWCEGVGMEEVGRGEDVIR